MDINKFHNLYSPPYFIRVTKQMKVQWAVHMAHTKNTILIQKSKNTRQTEGPSSRRKWSDWTIMKVY